jgi:vitamin B12 transporter
MNFILKAIRLRLTSDYQFNPKQAFKVGGELIDAHYQKSADPKINRLTQAVFAQYLQRWGNFDLRINGRRDEIKVDQKEKFTKPRYQSDTGLVGLTYALTPELKMGISHGSSFRSPAAGELFGWGGNTQLKPETHTSTEASAVYAVDALNARLIHFNTETDNAIAWDSTLAKSINIPTKNKGYEASVRNQWGNWALSTALTLQNPVNAQTGANLARRSKTFGQLGVDYIQSAFDVGAKLMFSDVRPDSDFTPTRLPGYEVVNLTAGLKLNEGWSLRGRIENVLNQSYSLAHGYSTSGRAAYLTLLYQQR